MKKKNNPKELALGFFLWVVIGAGVWYWLKGEKDPADSVPAPSSVAQSVVEEKQAGYAMRCMENPQDWSAQYRNPEKTIDEDAKKNLTDLTPKIKKMWADLKPVMDSAEFKAQGLSSPVFQKWDEAHKTLLNEVLSKLSDFSYTNTDYSVCEQAVQYGLAFQKEYARAMASFGDAKYPTVKKQEAELMKYFKYLPE